MKQPVQRRGRSFSTSHALSLTPEPRLVSRFFSGSPGLDCGADHGHLSREKRFPAAGETITLVFVPSSVGTAPTENQLVVFRSVCCCKTKLVGVEGQTTATALVPVLMIGKSGVLRPAPGKGINGAKP